MILVASLVGGCGQCDNYQALVLRSAWYESEVPGGRQTKVVPLVVIPVVVDVETLGIEVAHVDTVTVGATKNCPLSS